MNTPSIPSPASGSQTSAARELPNRPQPPVFALLVGIDHYAPASGVRPLQGARNDVHALATLFTRLLKVPAENIYTLTDEAATVDSFVETLRRLSQHKGADGGSPARPHVWVHFAGYGSLTPSVAGSLEPGLVLWDSRTSTGRDLPLSELIARCEVITDRCDVTVLLDCGYRPASRAEARAGSLPVVRALAPQVNARARQFAPPAAAAHARGSLTIVSAATPGAPAFELPLADLEGRLWRGGLTLAVEEYLRACLPTLLAGAHCDLTTPPATEMARRLSDAHISQLPHISGSGAMLREARKQAAALAPPLVVDAEEAGLFWVNGGLVQGLREGLTLQSQDELGKPVQLEVVEVGFDRCGCLALRDGVNLSLPVTAVPVAAPVAKQQRPGQLGKRVRLPAVRLQAATLEVPDGLHARLELAPPRPAPSPERACLDDILPEPAPEGLEAWPDDFAPVLPPDEIGGPVRLALAGDSGLPLGVTPATPLRLTCELHVSRTVRQPQALIALVWDGSDFYPVARAAISPRPPLPSHAPDLTASRMARLNATDEPPTVHSVTLEIDSLPPLAPTSGVKQAAGRSLELYLYTVCGQDGPELGLYQVRHVPQAWAAASAPAQFSRRVADGELRYTPALPARAGEKVALLLHGFADDSADLARWLLTDLRQTGVAYDRVLVFEYESLGTSVEENAVRLAAALRVLGFGLQPGAQAATLHLFGHSMGGLIGRWYLEQAGGDRVVDRLFVFGAPNLGTPLASAALLTPWLVAAAINVARPSLPSLVVAWALGTVALDMSGPADLRPGADSLALLNRAQFAGRSRIYALAGNGASRAVYGSAEERPGRLLARLAGGTQAVVSLFFGGANDLAVSQHSALALKPGRAPGSTLLTAVAPVHHLGFFTSRAVTEQVARWLREDEPAVG